MVFIIGTVFCLLFILAYCILFLDPEDKLFLPGKANKLKFMRKRYKLGIIFTILYLLLLVHSEYTSTNIAGYLFTALLMLFGFPIIITYFGICYALTLKGKRKFVVLCISLFLLLIPFFL